MAKIKEFYYGFWTGGKPFCGKWYEGFISEWHSPLNPRQYFFRYLGFGVGGIYSLFAFMIYIVIASMATGHLSRLNLIIALTIAITIGFVSTIQSIRADYRPFSFCPKCQTDLTTVDIFRSIKNRWFAAAFQHCRRCGFKREYKILDPPLRQYVLDMIDKRIPPPSTSIE